MKSRLTFAFAVVVLGFLGCSDEKAVIPTTPLTEDQKKAIEAEDKKVADEESHGAKRR